MYNRRRFVTGLGLATIAAACKRVPVATRDDKPGVAPAPAPPAPARQTPEPVDTGFARVDGRAHLVLDHDDVVELRRDTLIRRNGSLAVTSQIAMEDARDFAVLADRSVVLLAWGKNHAVHHIVNGKSVGKQPIMPDAVLPSASVSAYWAVGPWIARVDVATGKQDKSVWLPDNTYGVTAVTASDGSVLVASLHGILRVERELTTYQWDEPASHLGPGPAADLVWAAREPRLSLLKLEGGKATETAKLALAHGESLLHFTGKGDHAAATIAHTVAPHRAACALVVYDTHGEKWRASLGEYRTCVAALSATRVAVAAVGDTARLLRVWDLATGKQLASSES
ncbi:MAG: hypothetical protein ACM31C_30860 [Acidobacteriota bacterium]